MFRGWPRSGDCLAIGCGAKPFLKQQDHFSFWPRAIAEGAAVALFDRARGIIAREADLPLAIVDLDP